MGQKLIEQGGFKYNNSEEKIEAFLIESGQKDKNTKKHRSKHHVFFADKEHLEKLGSITDTQIDGTFKTCPSMPGIYQLVTIMTTINNQVRS